MSCQYCRAVRGADEEMRNGFYCARYWHLLPADLCLACLLRPKRARHISESPHAIRGTVSDDWPAEVLRRVAGECV
jgi:hypothetical protein